MDKTHERELSKELQSYRPRRLQRYSAVNVLLLSWVEGDAHFSKERDHLSRMFQRRFNYAVRPFAITSVDSQRLLNLHVAQFIEHFGRPEKLIVVYYGGHGGPSTATGSECTWAA